jgi:hypothetical protein
VYFSLGEKGIKSTEKVKKEVKNERQPRRATEGVGSKGARTDRRNDGME